jgi:hypothetical protein
MPLAYADQFYVLREHIGFVRARLTQSRDGRREMSDAFDTADAEADEADAAAIEARAAGQADNADQAAETNETDAAPATLNEAAEIGETRADERRKPD